MIMKKIFSLIVTFLAIIFFGCAFDIVHVDQVPVEYEHASTNKQRYDNFTFTNAVYWKRH